jgi:metacaspase-1
MGKTTRADANIAAQPTGAMSWAFIAAMKKNPQQSYVQLLNSIRDELATKYTQRPQLSCSHPLSKLRDVSLVMRSGTDLVAQIPTYSL